MRDDILDVTADFEALGKTPGKMWWLGNQHPALLGLDKSYDILEDLLTKLRLSSKNLAESQVLKGQRYRNHRKVTTPCLRKE